MECVIKGVKLKICQVSEMNAVNILITVRRARTRTQPRMSVFHLSFFINCCFWLWVKFHFLFLFSLPLSIRFTLSVSFVLYYVMVWLSFICCSPHFIQTEWYLVPIKMRPPTTTKTDRLTVWWARDVILCCCCQRPMKWFSEWLLSLYHFDKFSKNALENLN